MSQAPALEQAFKRALEAIPARVLHGGLAVAYSGGLDSTVLLHLAAQWAREQGLPLHALHVHHGLSANADAWALHCQQVCAALGLACRVMRVSVQAEGEGLEQAARQVRYRALFAACRELQVQALLTAHHQNDQAETVLLNLLRGAGVAGLGGIHEQTLRSDAAQVHLLRPLLDQSRATLQAWAESQHLSWVEDESNQALHLRRNRLRNSLLPAIEEHFPAASAALARSARHLRDAQRLLEQLASIDMQSATRQAGAALDLASVSALAPERIDNLLRYWLKQRGLLAPTSAQLEDVHRQVLEAAADRQPGIRLGDFILHRARGLLQLSPAVPAPPGQDLPVEWKGEASIAVPSWHGRLCITPCAGEGVPAAVLESGLRISPRRGGERLRLHADRPSRSLKNLYQENELPAWRRPWLPLVFGSSGLLYAAALGMNSESLQAGPAYRLHWESDWFS